MGTLNLCHKMPEQLKTELISSDHPVLRKRPKYPKRGLIVGLLKNSNIEHILDDISVLVGRIELNFVSCSVIL